MEDEDVTANCNVIAYDLPRHGKSDPPLNTKWWEEEYRLTADHFVNFIVKLCDALELEDPIFMGSSFGGNVALQLALRHPNRFKAVIPVEAAARAPRFFLDLWRHPHANAAQVCASGVWDLMAPQSPDKDRGFQVERDANSVGHTSSASSLALAPKLTSARNSTGSGSSDIQLYMFQTGTLRTKTKFIKMKQGEDDFEIPVPWFLIDHSKGNVVIDGDNAIETALDKRGHWGDVVEAYDPIMDACETCVEQCRSVGVAPEDVRYVLQSHLPLDHSGAVGRFPNAQCIVQRAEYEYAFNPHWFSAGAYIRADFDRPGLDWKFSGGEYTDNSDLFGDGTIRIIFTPGHFPGHQSFLVTLPNAGPVLLTIDAANPVAKLKKITEDTGAFLVTGHDPDNWKSFKKAPNQFYD